MSEGNLLFQSEKHPLVPETYSSIETYCLSLIHRRAYERAAEECCGKRVLDVGCNNGYGSRIIADVAESAVGADVSPNSIECARAKSHGRNLRFLVIDGKTLPFESQEFDVVTCFQVIEHVDEPGPFLEELRRVLRPTGLAVFSTPNSLIRLEPGMKPWNPFHVCEYSADELRSLLEFHFATVDVFGLFGTSELSAIELTRVEKRKQRAARRRNSGVVHRLGRKSLRFARQAIRRNFGQLLGVLRGSGFPQGEGKQALASGEIERFSTGDLFYRTDNLSRALDLMAVCSLDGDTRVNHVRRALTPRPDAREGQRSVSPRFLSPNENRRRPNRLDG